MEEVSKKNLVQIIGGILLSFLGLFQNCKCKSMCCKSSCDNKGEVTPSI